MKYVASVSYGKDSLAMLHVVTDVLGWQLDRIITADVWATDTISADLPPMENFKIKADKIIKERWGIEVEHFCAINKDGTPNNYQKQFYAKISEKRLKQREIEFSEPKQCCNPNGDIEIYGFPLMKGAWCKDRLKREAIKEVDKISKGCVQYIGIAADEPSRFHNASDKKLLPLVEAGWTEADCRKWCEENDLLSPIYAQAARGGCWFCHNQGVNQLRLLRKQYPEYWQMLLKWDDDSLVTFKPDGHTVHDYDKRFQLEDEGFIIKPFRWSRLECPQTNIFMEEEE